MSSGARRSREQRRVYLLFGEDEYRVAADARKVVDELCPPAEQTLGLEIIEGQVQTAEEGAAALARTLEGLRTVGLLGGRKVVWLRDAVFFYDNPVARAAEVKIRVDLLTDEIRKGLAPGQYLVVTAPKVDGRSGFFKACESQGVVVVHKKPEKGFQEEREARETADELFRQAGLEAADDVLEVFVQRVGFDTRQLAQEVEKLRLYVHPERRVRREDVEAVVCASRESAVWDLTDALAEGDLRAAWQALRRLLAQKESPIGLIHALEAKYRELAVMRACVDRGWVRWGSGERYAPARWSEAPEVDETLGRLGKSDPRTFHPYRAWRLGQQAARLPAGALSAARRKILRVHEQMVAGGPQELLLEMLVLELARLPHTRESVAR